VAVIAATPLHIEQLQAFSAKLGDSLDPTSLRRAILASLQHTVPAASTIFFEADDWAGRMVPVEQLGTDRRPAFSFPRAGALARWLRVNDELLALANNRDVWDYLPPEEQAALTALDSLACLPLVADAELVAFVAFCDTTSRPELEGQRVLLQRCARLAAVRWRDAVRVERIQTRSELLRRSQQLGVAGQMAASVAHEVRNPLAAVRSLVQFAREVELPIGEREAMLDDVLQEVDRIDRTLTNMLQLSQPTSADHGAVPVTELVDAVTRFVRAYARRRGVNVQLGATTPTLSVVADERELRQVVTNLLLNACQACEGSGNVTTSVTRIDDDIPWVEIAIVDSGQGISAQDLDRVFEPFFTTRPQGTGLGLPFCRDAIERLGGRIAIQSVRGAGTSVYVRLPLLVTDAHDSGR